MKDGKRIFFHNGTKYIYTGDHSLAHYHFHEVRAHLGSMKRTNVNDLKLITGAKEFTDGTVAKFLVDHGLETVEVFAPIYNPVPSGGVEPRKTVDEVEQIVPVFRSGDNRYWVVCLSGTFEPEYYLFENIYDIPVEAFDDNTEDDLDGQLISIGRTFVEDSIDVPELRFVAQTGIRPEESDIDLTGDLSETNNFTSSAGTIHVILCWNGTMGRNAWTSEGYRIAAESRSIMVFNTNIGLPTNGFTAIDEANRYGSSCVVYNESGVTEQDVIDTCGNIGNQGPIPDEDIFSIPGGEYYNQWNTTYTANGCSLWSSNYSVRIEANNHQNHAACYRVTTVETYTHRIRDYEMCDLEGALLEEDVTVTTTRCDYLKVNSTVYQLREENDETYPQFDNIGLKYYNTDSIASLTAMLGSYITGQNQYGYYYVGPNSNNELVSTNFPRMESGPSRHTIPNMIDEDGNLIEFYGEIFLGRIVYEVERKLSDREV